MAATRGLAIDLERVVALLRELPYYFSLVDAEDRIVWVSHSAVPSAEVIGRTVLDITEPASHGAVLEALAAARRGGSGVWVAHSTIPGLGDATFRCTSHHVTMTSAEFFVLVVTANISEQRRAEVALEASENRYRALLEAHPDYIATIDSDRRLRSFNRVAPGLTTDQVLGRRVEEFLAPETAAVAIPILQRTIADGTPGHFPGVARLPEGDRHFDTRVLRLPPEDGETRVMIITTDITEARDAAESIRKGEANLAQAQRLEIVGQLAGGVAHDFNNMLLVIQAHADLAQRRVTDPAVVTECLGSIRAAVERASELTHQLLAVARRQTIAMRPVELGGLLDETIRLLGRTLPETIRIRRLGRSTAWVQGDAGQLSQVLVNLAINARDAMPTGGELVFELGLRPGTDSEIRLSVRDTGQGIAPELIGRVFEPFFTTKTEGPSYGLGLAVANGIIRQHDGRLEVESELGRGSCFHIDLPAAGEATLPARPTTAVPAGSGALILLAEDEEPVRRVVTAMLEQAGYRVLPAETGAAAIATIRARADLALAILDAVMPQGTGRDVYEVIRAERPELPVLFTTGYGAGVLTEGLGKEPCVGLLPKPYTMNELLAAVARLITTRSTHHVPPT